MEVDSFIDARPMLFHTAALANLDAIKATRVLASTESLLRGTRHEHLLGARRPDSAVIELQGRQVVVRDQRPLRVGSLDLLGMTLDEWIGELNRRVFFWPGTANGPISRGRKHFELYSRAGPVVVIRASIRALMKVNPESSPFVSTCNSGSARHQQGRPVTRGRGTYRPLDSAPVKPIDVVEVSFADRVRLPETTEIATALSGPWCRLGD
jgi:hypothetical protein